MLEWDLLCFGCGDGEFCAEPNNKSEVTFCQVLEDPIPSSSSAPFEKAAFARLAAPRASGTGFLRVPMVSDPSRWKTVQLNLSNPFRHFRQDDLGWIVTFLRTPGPATPVITPPTVPVAVGANTDRALCASVVLPESGGPHQYWVPVLEQFRWAQLQTFEWTVIFLRAPLP